MPPTKTGSHIRGLKEPWSDNMKPNSRDMLVMEQACGGCYQARYNMGRGFRESERDCPVPGYMCWHVPSVPYNRRTGRYECGLNIRRR